MYIRCCSLRLELSAKLIVAALTLSARYQSVVVVLDEREQNHGYNRSLMYTAACLIRSSVS